MPTKTQPKIGKYSSKTTFHDFANSMAVNVLQAAKYLGQQTGWKLTRLEMQKMIYLAHMLHIGRNNSPLVEGDFEAWKYGPVHPDLYRETIKNNSLKPNKKNFEYIRDIDNKKNKSAISALNRIVSDFSPGDGWKLVRITHWRDGAWSKNYKKYSQVVIPESDIKLEYGRRNIE